jgi:hypothetical protein
MSAQLDWDAILAALESWLGRRVIVTVLADDRTQLAALSGTLGRALRPSPHLQGTAFFSVSEQGHTTGPAGFVLNPETFRGADHPTDDMLLIALRGGGLMIQLDD